MKRIEVILKEKFNLSVKRRLAGKEIVELIVPEYGIAIVNESVPTQDVMVSAPNAVNSTNYHIISVNKKKLDDQLYVGEKTVAIFWALIEAGYLRKLRVSDSRKHKILLIAHKWAIKIIQKRLDMFKDRPKYKYLIEENKNYLSNLTLSYMSNPEFFDTL